MSAIKKGYFGIGVYSPKTAENIGTLWRSAHNFGADFIFTIGHRYRRQPGDTTKAQRHIPLYEYQDFDDFKAHLPVECQIVFIEQVDGARLLPDVNHPQMAAYVLGAEDHGVPVELMKGHQKIAIDTPMCLNVAVAGSIVLFDRHARFQGEK